MKKTLTCLLLAVLLSLALISPALAAVNATPTQQLALRAGPGYSYAWVGSLSQSAGIRAFEYERLDDGVWVLVEYNADGAASRAYALLDHLAIKGAIPWADHLEYEVILNSRASVRTAPADQSRVRATLSRGSQVTLLGYEGDYAFVEFYDSASNALTRGYLPKNAIETYDGGGAYRSGVYAAPNQRLSFRTGPNTAYTELYTLPETTQITAYAYEEGNDVTWVLVEYMYKNERVRAYTGLKRMTVYGDIPWEAPLNETVYTRYGCEVYTAPATDAGRRNRLNGGASATLIHYDGDYALVEYTDRDSGKPERGYVALADIYGYDIPATIPDNSSSDWNWNWNDNFGE